jgi:hypothetical protein
MYPASDIARSRELGRPVRLTLIDALRYAYEDHDSAIREAAALYLAMRPHPMPYVHGSGVSTRMAHRLICGYTIEQAAAREYVYRWSLTLDAWANTVSAEIRDIRFDGRSRQRWTGGAFGVMHTLGM